MSVENEFKGEEKMMKVDYVGKSFEDILDPAAYLRHMYRNTDEMGTSYIPGFFYYRDSESDMIYHCEMNWTESDVDQLSADFAALNDSLKMIADRTVFWLDSTPESESELDLDSDLQLVYDTYLRRIDVEGFDHTVISDIDARLDVKTDLEGKSVFISDTNPYFGLDHIEISDEELKLYDDYCDAYTAKAVDRLGEGFFTTTILFFASRLYRLYQLDVPYFIIGKEACALIKALALHRHLVSYSKNIVIS